MDHLRQPLVLLLEVLDLQNGLSLQDCVLFLTDLGDGLLLLLSIVWTAPVASLLILLLVGLAGDCVDLRHDGLHLFGGLFNSFEHVENRLF